MKHLSKSSLFSLTLILGLLCSSLSFSPKLSAQSRKDRVFRLVLDPGHGGSQRLGKGTWYKQYRERHLTLSIAGKVQKLIKSRHPEVRILTTRDKNVHVPLERRARFSRRIGADLFLSIHVNHAVAKTAWGTESFIIPRRKEAFNLNYIKGSKKRLTQQRNRALSAEFATLLEHQYKKLGRKSRGVKEKNLQVLRENSVPAVLTEVGFLSNAKDRQVICTRAGQNRIAKAIANAFTSYYKRHRKAPARATRKKAPNKKATKTRAKASAKPKTKAKANAPKVQAKAKTKSKANEQVWYRVQFMATSKWIDTNSKEFKRFGVSIRRTKKIDGLYRYMAGNYKTLYSVKKLRSKMRHDYKDCFIVKVNSKGERIEAIY